MCSMEIQELVLLSPIQKISEYIVANIQGISIEKENGISLGRTGYSFKISYINSNDKDIIPVFILNSDNTICKDPFFYRCDGGLCFDYLKACEEKYKTNATESIEKNNLLLINVLMGRWFLHW